MRKILEAQTSRPARKEIFAGLFVYCIYGRRQNAGTFSPHLIEVFEDFDFAPWLPRVRCTLSAQHISGTDRPDTYGDVFTEPPFRFPSSRKRWDAYKIRMLSNCLHNMLDGICIPQLHVYTIIFYLLHMSKHHNLSVNTTHTDH